MSRSYRKPYTAVTGTGSAHADKKLAARGLRRRQNHWLHTLTDFEEALAPHRLECAFNNTYAWARDGRQHIIFPGHQNTPRYEYMHRYWLKLHRK